MSASMIRRNEHSKDGREASIRDNVTKAKMASLISCYASKQCTQNVD